MGPGPKGLLVLSQAQNQPSSQFPLRVTMPVRCVHSQVGEAHTDPVTLLL